MAKTHLAAAFAVLTISLAFAQPPAPDAPQQPTKAERITRIRENIENGKAAMAKLEARLVEPAGEYQQAKEAFEDLDRRLKAEQESENANGNGLPEDPTGREEALKALREEWKLARDRFDLAIKQREASQQTIAALRQRIEQEQKELDRLEGVPVAAPSAPAPAQPALVGPPAPVAQPTGENQPAAIPVAVPGVPLPVPAAANPTPAAQQQPAPRAIADDPAVRRARERAEASQKALHEAEDTARSATERLQALALTIEAAGKVLAAERESAELFQQQITRLADRLQNNPPDDFRERQELADRMAEASARLSEARGRINRLTDKLADLNADLHTLRAEELAAVREAEARKAEAQAADEFLAELTSPFAPRNAARWLATHGPNLLAVLAVTFTLYLGIRVFSRQIVRVVTRTNNRGTEEDRENRANTLVGVFRYAAGTFVLGGGVVMFLDEAGIPIVPLMGGAAVLGLAVAFGAQNLIKDYFSGFMMLMEDQYGVNDVVKIGSTAGLVEQITLRVTVLRDLEGVRHFIPHGSVSHVSNMTHTWSRALFDIPVAYGEDVDRAMDVLVGLARELRADPLFGRYILDDAEMLGVDAFDSSAVIIKFLIKTRPLKQWLVKREMLRRIKNRFDQLGITIPFPHRTVYHKFPDTVPQEAQTALRWPA